MNRYIITALLCSLIFVGCGMAPTADELADFADFGSRVVVDFQASDSVMSASYSVDPETLADSWVATEAIRMSRPIAIIGTLMAFLTPIAIVWIVCFFIYRTKRDRSRVVYESIVTGRPIPPGYFPPRQPQGATLRSAVSYIAWGVGGCFFFICVGAEEVSCLFLVPIIIGLGRLAAFFLYDYKRKDTHDQGLNEESH